MRKVAELVMPSLAKASVLWLLAALLMVVLPHAPRVPPLVTALFLGMISWRYLITLHRRPLPARFLRWVLTIASIGVVYNAYGTVIGRDAGIALLVAMLGVKLLEMSLHRDAYVAVLIGYFLVITHFLYSQSILTAAYMFTVVVIITATLIELNRHKHHGRSDVIPNLKLAGALLVQAVPFMLVLFVLFPRVATPLWGLPDDAFGGQSGLSDEMSPGDISDLIQSDEVAFRVQFDGPVPNSALRYWRGPVLSHTDGRRWRAAASPEVLHTLPEINPRSAPIKYTVTLEPHKRRWLYALDVPAAIPERARVTRDLQLRVQQEVRQRLRYDAASVSVYQLTELTARERAENLQLPLGANPRAVELGQRWRSESGDDKDIVSKGLVLFNREPFVYTLQPPLLASLNPVDEFLFSTRQGFCEHFSSAFVTLMRAAGVPARVMLGYQGGELNPLGNYLIVRQRDAHAWAEVYLEQGGWVRVDPTSMVAPERTQRALRLTPGAIGERARFDIDDDSFAGRTIRQLRLSWDSVNNGWNQWVLSYSQEQQSNLLRGLGVGIDTWMDMVLVLSVAIAALLAIVASALLIYRRQRRDAVQRLWDAACRKLAKRGLTRLPHEGPNDFAQRVVTRLPQQGNVFNEIAHRYVQLRYGQECHDRRAELLSLKRQVRQFQP